LWAGAVALTLTLTGELVAISPVFAWFRVAAEVSETLDRAAAAYADGAPARSAELVSEAYFGLFEESGLEVAIRRYVSARRARELERMFANIRQAITARAAPGEVRRQVAALRKAIEGEAREIQRQGVTSEDLRSETAEPQAAETEGVAERATPDASAQLLVQLSEASARYAGAARGEARALLDSAYFDQFEGQGLEAIIGARAPARKTAIEARFVRIRGLMSAGASPDTVAGQIEALRGDIRDAIAQFSASRGPWQAVLGSALIIIREGFEAMLILTALVAYLVKAGHGDRVRALYQAAGVAVLCSLLTALAFRSLTRLAGRHQELLEGVSMLAAAAVLVYVSYWLTSRAEAHRWQAYLRSKVQAALGTGRVAALWAAAFLAVYREGAETVLFYQALLAGTSGESREILAGLGIGSVVLAALFVLLRSGAERIPMHAFFAWTSLLLYGMALVFAGQGVRALQALGTVSASPTPWRLTLDWVGFYPTWESVGLQLFLLVAALVALVVVVGGRASGGREAAPGERSTT
jgi:high-affinity iron transporter